MGAELKGKVAIVTGAASGIGRATAHLFVAEGAQVVLADINAEAGEALARELGGQACFQQTDVCEAAQVQALVARAASEFGGLHILFNNAGISGAQYPHFLDDDLADFHKVLDTNLNSEYRIAHQVLGMSFDQLATCNRYAYEASFLPEAARAGIWTRYFA